MSTNLSYEETRRVVGAVLAPPQPMTFALAQKILGGVWRPGCLRKMHPKARNYNPEWCILNGEVRTTAEVLALAERVRAEKQA